METYKVIVEITVGEEWPGHEYVAEKSNIPMTKSHRNALIREQLWLRVSNALHIHGLDPHAIKSVVKVQRKGDQA